MTFAEPAPSCATAAVANWEQIQFLLGHVSVQTTERYLGCKQNLSHPVNDRFEIAPAESQPGLNTHWPVLGSYHFPGNHVLMRQRSQTKEQTSGVKF